MRVAIFSSKLIGAEFKRNIDFRSFNSYKIRIAQTYDIPFIRNCNIQNLPENYNENFYNDQLNKWPKLTLLCKDSQENVIAYAMGRVLFRDKKSNGVMLPASIPSVSNSLSNVVANNAKENNSFGHVLSIAVSEAHRGRSIARELMDFMHVQFATSYDIDNIDLYCRVSFIIFC